MVRWGWELCRAVLCEGPSLWPELDLPELVREEDVGLISVHSLPPTSSELVAGPGVIAAAGSSPVGRGSPTGCAEMPSPAGRVEAPSSLLCCWRCALWCSGCSGWVPFQGVPGPASLGTTGTSMHRSPNPNGAEQTPARCAGLIPGLTPCWGAVLLGTAQRRLCPLPTQHLDTQWPLLEQLLAAVGRMEPLESTCTTR